MRGTLLRIVTGFGIWELWDCNTPMICMVYRVCLRFAHHSNSLVMTSVFVEDFKSIEPTSRNVVQDIERTKSRVTHLFLSGSSPVFGETIRLHVALDARLTALIGVEDVTRSAPNLPAPAFDCDMCGFLVAGVLCTNVHRAKKALSSVVQASNASILREVLCRLWCFWLAQLHTISGKVSHGNAMHIRVAKLYRIPVLSWLSRQPLYTCMYPNLSQQRKVLITKHLHLCRWLDRNYMPDTCVQQPMFERWEMYFTIYMHLCSRVCWAYVQHCCLPGYSGTACQEACMPGTYGTG
eukprot:scpid91755/ scgid0097/ 